MLELDVVIGLGANIGPCVETLVEARSRLSELGRVQSYSRLYKSAPLGPDQPDFYNAALRLSTALDFEALLRQTLALERSFGRTRDVRWGPRILDLDLLWAANSSFDGPELVVPHPRLVERAFALAPLLDVAPDAGHAGLSYASLLAGLSSQRCEAVSEPGW